MIVQITVQECNGCTLKSRGNYFTFYRACFYFFNLLAYL
jgi:hypothetical protein